MDENVGIEELEQERTLWLKDERDFPDFDQTLISEALCNPERGQAFDPATIFSVSCIHR